VYWAANRLWLKGANPYQTKSLCEIYAALGAAAQSADFCSWHRLWYPPPWSLPLLSLFLRPTFLLAGYVWIGLSFICLALIFTTARSAGGAPWPRHLALFALSLLLSMHAIGPQVQRFQLGFLQALAVLGLFCSMHNKRYLPAGLWCAVLAIKPHLFLLPGCLWLWQRLREKCCRPSVACLSAPAAASLIAVAFTAQIFSHWLESLNEPPLFQQSSDLAGLLRKISIDLLRTDPRWLTLVVPHIGVLISWLWLSRRKAPIDWRYHGPCLALWSLFIAPYSHVHDHVIILPASLLLLAYQAAGRQKTT